MIERQEPETIGRGDSGSIEPHLNSKKVAQKSWQKPQKKKKGKATGSVVRRKKKQMRRKEEEPKTAVEKAEGSDSEEEVANQTQGKKTDEGTFGPHRLRVLPEVVRVSVLFQSVTVRNREGRRMKTMTGPHSRETSNPRGGMRKAPLRATPSMHRTSQW